MEFSGVLLIIGLIYLIRLCLKINTKQNKNAIDISNIINSLEELKAQKDSKELDIEKEEIEEFVNDIEIEPDYKPSSLSIKEEIYIETVLSPKHEWEEVPKEQTETVEQEDVPYLDNNESKSIIQKEEKSFFEKYPDIEKFVGENLINKIGIVILVLGLGFLVKYAIDKNWINEIGRVAIGVISASILIATAHKLRKDYKSFSSVLIGGGLALLYFTISYAFHTEGYPLYQEQTTAFLILFFITVFAVALSVLYNRIEIAILALIGGFSSPIMISNGSGNYVVFFSYIMMLNIGALVLSFYKKWRLVNIIAFGLTVLSFSSWLILALSNEKYTEFSGAIFFATGFYVIFFLMNILYNIKHKIEFKSIDISLLLANTVSYFTFAMLMLPYINDGIYKGLFTIFLAAFNLVFAYFIYKREAENKNLLFLLVGLVLTFVTLAIPLQLEGNYITLFWSVESVLLLWLSQKSGFKVMKIGSSLVTVLMLVSIVMDWGGSYSLSQFSSDDYIKQYDILFNKMVITTLVSVCSLAAISFLLRNEKEDYFDGISVKFYQSIIVIWVFVVFYVGFLLEANYQSFHYFVQESSQYVVLYTYNALYFLFLIIFASKIKHRELTVASSVIGVVFIIVFLISISNVYSNSINAIITGKEQHINLLLIFRWLSIIAVYFTTVLLFKLIKRTEKILDQDFSTANLVFIITVFIYLLSADLDTIAALISNSKSILLHTQKTGYAIIWGLSSFVLMILGMKRKNKMLRILSLVLFGITLIKLFLYDISNISEGGKIIAFILLGILLLIISFMYQKVKKMVTDDDATTEGIENQ